MKTNKTYEELSEADKQIIRVLSYIVPDQYATFETNASGITKTWKATSQQVSSILAKTTITTNFGLKVTVVYNYDSGEETFKAYKIKVQK